MISKQEKLLTMMESIAPQFYKLTTDVLFGQVWTEQSLSPRDRSLITVAALVALNRVEQLPIHLERAIDNDLSVEELSAAMTHLAFYAGWPTTASALERLTEIDKLREV